VLCPTEGGKGIVKKSKIALKPYLDTIAGHCSTLSNQELRDILNRFSAFRKEVKEVVNGSDLLRNSGILT
jgi:hypothetical protein